MVKKMTNQITLRWHDLIFRTQEDLLEQVSISTKYAGMKWAEIPMWKRRLLSRRIQNHSKGIVTVAGEE
jgi:hypothetical protein